MPQIPDTLDGLYSMLRVTCPIYFRDDILSITDVAGYWVAQGGDPLQAAPMTAIAWAESSRKPYACSCTANIGLWQIGTAWADAQNVLWQQLFDPGTNAWFAVSIFNARGGSYQDWDVAYAAGESLTSRPPIYTLEPGSAAAALLPQVALALGVTGPTGPPVGVPSGTPGVAVPPAPAGSPGNPVPPRPQIVVPGTGGGIPRGLWQMPQLVVPPAHGSGWDALVDTWGPVQTELYDGLKSQIYQLGQEFGGT
jgi:hypothetical protein